MPRSFLTGEAESKPKIVELVGLPGTGKSTVVRTMLANGEGRIQETRLSRWRNARFVLKNACFLWLPFCNQYTQIEGRRWNKFFIMIRLETLADLLAPSRTCGADIVLLDQGPVYMLSILQRALGASAPRGTSRIFEQYWKKTLAAWSETLDCVVQLEASDDVLYQRILDRGTSHPVTYRTRDEASQFFERARLSRNRILSKLQSQKGTPALVRLRTDELSLQETIGRILAQVRSSAP